MQISMLLQLLSVFITVVKEMIAAKLQFLRQEEEAYLFHSSETLSTSASIAARAAAGMHIPNIQELDGDSERYIWRTVYNKLGANYTWQGKMLVIDLGSYPYIIAYLDDRDQTPDPGDDSQFAKDVYRLWLEPFDLKKVPTIIVNSNLPFTGVKYILC